MNEGDEHLEPPLLERSDIRPGVRLSEVLDRTGHGTKATRTLGLADDRYGDLAGPGRVGSHVG